MARSPVHSRFVRYGGRIKSVSRSLPFLEMVGVNVEESGMGRRCARSVARWENTPLRWEESLAYVLRAVNAIWALQVVEILLSI